MDYIKTIHVKVCNRRTTVTLNSMLYKLASMSLSGEVENKTKVSEYLSNNLTELFGGNRPKNDGQKEKIKYRLSYFAAEMLLCRVADKRLIVDELFDD